MLFKHFVLLLTYLLSLVLVVEGISFLKFVNFIKFLVFNVEMSFEISFIIFDEDVHWFGLRVSHDRRMFSVNWGNFTLGFGNVLLISVCVIFVSWSILDTFRGSSLCYKVLKTITYPNQKEICATHCAEPIDRGGNISRSVVSMARKESTDCNTPNSFKRVLKLEDILSF